MISCVDINLCLGLPSIVQHGAVTTLDALFTRLAPLGISRGVVWHVAQHDAGPDAGNALLAEALGDDTRALGCWTILPPCTDRALMTDDWFDRMQEARVVALRAFPAHHRFHLNRLTFGAFLDEVAARRIPLLLSPRFDIDWAGITGVLEDYPTLTVVLCDVGVWGQDRYTWPLVRHFPHVYLETGLVSLEAGGLEAAVHALGAERLLFGSGYPWRTPEAAVLDLLHAEISAEARTRIAGGNLRALLEGGRNAR